MEQNNITLYSKNRDPEKLPYTLTNDYLFRAVFQSRPKALEGLCRAVLGLSEKDIISITLQNPIELGKKIKSKDFILDLAIELYPVSRAPGVLRFLPACQHISGK